MASGASESPRESQQLFGDDWLHIIDSGGQPRFLSLKTYELSGIVETGRALGQGVYGSFTEVKYKGISYAAKRLHQTLLGIQLDSWEIWFRGPAKLTERWIKECTLHSQLNHPNIVQIVGIYYSRLSGSPLPALVMELLPTNLGDYLDRQHGPLPNETRCSILRDVAQGLRYLHHRPVPIMHRDLTASNVLLTEDLHAKISEFSAAEILTPITRSRAMSRFPGTPYAMPPETMVRDPRYGTEIDIFSFGVLMLYVCTEECPLPSLELGYGGSVTHLTEHFDGYQGGRSRATVARTEVERRKRYFDKMSPSHPLRSLIIDCLADDPADRPTATHILSQLQKIILDNWVSSQRFQEAMKCYVEAGVVVLLLTGAAGAGKTHAKHLFLGLPPPTLRQSTPLIEEAVRSMSIQRAMVSGETELVWEPVTLEMLKQMIANTVTAEELQEYRHSIASLPSPQALAPHAEASEPAQPLRTQKPASLSSVSGSSEEAQPQVQPSRNRVEEEILELMMSTSGSRKLFDVDWVYLIDSGGQPSFREILPLFVHVASAIAFVTKLNERLSDRPTVEWYKDGKKYTSYPSPLTNEEIFRHSLQGMRSRQSLSTRDKSPQVFVVGTHRDLEHTCAESRQEKNRRLLGMLQPHLGEKLTYYNPKKPEQIIYPVNAKDPSDTDKEVARQFRRAVITNCSKARVRIPLPYYVLEQYIRELEATLERRVFHFRECEKEALKLRMNEEACEEALVYLDKVGMFFYRPEHLKGLVFSGLQVWVDKVNELTELMQKLQGPSDADDPAPCKPSDGAAAVSPDLTSTDSPPPSEDGHDAETTPPLGCDENPSSPDAIPEHSSKFRNALKKFKQMLLGSSNADQTVPATPAKSPVYTPEESLSSSEDGHDTDLAPLLCFDENLSSRDTLPEYSAYRSSDIRKFREYGIVTVDLLRKFPKHYVEGLFTPTELLQLLTAFQVTAPTSEGSHDYVMPCLLQELSCHKLGEHRQCGSPSLLAPLLIQFPDNWVPAGVFIVLISYLQNVAHWELCLMQDDTGLPSGNPRCLYRNCVEFYLPTGHGGFVTLIDSFKYLEVHMLDASDKACQKNCPRIVADVFHGIEAAARRLHYGSLKPKAAFLCPACSPGLSCPPVHHLASVVDDELVCSVSRRKTGELTRQHTVWPLSVEDALHVLASAQTSMARPQVTLQTSGIRHQVTPSVLNFAVFNDHPPELHELCDAAAEIADLYDQIGMGLGLTDRRLRIIRADSAGRPNQMQLCLTEVFSYWRNGRTLPYTWETFASVLLQPRLAPKTKLLLTELHKKLSDKYLG